MYARLAEKLADTGWSNCIPLIPGTKRSLVPWRVHRVFAVAEEQHAEWARRFPDAGVGYVIEPLVVAVEADVLDVVIAARLGALADCVLGPSPLIRIGRPPKWMAFYATTEMIPKIAAHPVEVIPASYHVVLYGIHEFTKRPYTWLGDEPLDTPPDRLPRITRAQVVQFLSVASEIVPTRRRSMPHAVNGDLFERLRAERAGKLGIRWLAVVERQLREAQPGELHDTLLSVSAALVGVGYDDRQIRDIIAAHFAAPRSGPYRAVWDQVGDAIAGARRRWTPRTAAPPPARLRMVAS
jgi:hypothetical protein